MRLGCALVERHFCCEGNEPFVNRNAWRRSWIGAVGPERTRWETNARWNAGESPGAVKTYVKRLTRQGPWSLVPSRVFFRTLGALSSLALSQSAEADPAPWRRKGADRRSVPLTMDEDKHRKAKVKC